MQPSMKKRIAWERWGALALALAVLVLAQACGSSGSSTGPAGGSKVALTLKRADNRQIPQGCTGVLIVTGPGVFISVPIPQDGVVTVTVPAGVPLTYTVQITCPTGTFTGEVTNVTAGAGENSVVVTVNANSPPSASVACTPNVNVNQGSSCTCSASDPDNDPLSRTWSASGGAVNPGSGAGTTFTSASPGTFTVTCQVNDGRPGGTVFPSAQVAVAPQNGSITVFNDILTLKTRTLALFSLNLTATFSGPSSIGSAADVAPQAHKTVQDVPAGVYTPHIVVDVYGPCEFDKPAITVVAGQDKPLHVTWDDIPNSCLNEG